MSIQTQYILTDGRAKRVYVRGFSAGIYSWTCRRADAMRIGRAAALSAADQIDALIADAGYIAKPLRVMPVSGGPCVERS